MSNGLTLSYPSQRQAGISPMLLVLSLGLLLGHYLILRLASIPPPTFKVPVQERHLRLSLSSLSMPVTGLEPAPSVTPAVKPPDSPPPDETPAAKAAERPAEKPDVEPAAPPPPVPDTKQPEPEPETAAASGPVEPHLPPLVNVRVADDTAAGQEKPPEKAQYEGATNTEAADRSDKKDLGPDPKVDGETAEMKTSGRRGETENRQAKRDDPFAGSVAKEGSPEPGKPPEPQEQVARRPEPEPARRPEPVAQPKPEEPAPVNG